MLITTHKQIHCKLFMICLGHKFLFASIDFDSKPRKLFHLPGVLNSALQGVPDRAETAHACAKTRTFEPS